MKLITKEIAKELEKYPILSQDGKGMDAHVIVKFFNPMGAGTWLVTEAEKLPSGDYKFFGYCHIYFWEGGYFYLSELDEYSDRLPFGLTIERDRWIGKNATVKELSEGVA